MHRISPLRVEDGRKRAYGSCGLLDSRLRGNERWRGPHPRGRAIGKSAKIAYCCARGLAASAASTNCSELLPMSARGRIITRMKRLGPQRGGAEPDPGPLSYHPPP